MAYSGPPGARAGTQTYFSPPTNFSAVTKNVYRSAYPAEANVPYLRHLGIRTVVLLSVELLPASVLRALAESPEGVGAALQPSSPSAATTPSLSTRAGTDPTSSLPGMSSREVRVIELADMSSWRVDVLGCGDDLSQQDVIRALDFAVDARWHPVLFCCPTGELQTSALVGCMRRYQGWSLASIYGECELFMNLQHSLRTSLMGFIEAWAPADYPVSKTDIALRHREWARERAQATWQLRRRHRRLLRHPEAHHPHLRGGTGGGAEGGGSVERATTPGPPRGSDVTDLSSAGSSEAETDASAHSGGRVPTATTSVTAGGVPVHVPTAEEGLRLAGSGIRPPSTWGRRRHTSAAGGAHGWPPHVGGDSDDAGAATAAAVSHGLGDRTAHYTSRHSSAATTATPPSHRARPFGASPLATFGDMGHEDVVFAAWFEEARRRNPRFCIDAEEGELRSFSLVDGAPLDAGEAVHGRASHEREERAMNFPKSVKEADDARLPPPHVLYASVRNPPVLDGRSTFTKQSIVDEDDD